MANRFIAAQTIYKGWGGSEAVANIAGTSATVRGYDPVGFAAGSLSTHPEAYPFSVKGGVHTNSFDFLPGVGDIGGVDDSGGGSVDSGGGSLGGVVGGVNDAGNKVLEGLCKFIPGCEGPKIDPGGSGTGLIGLFQNGALVILGILLIALALYAILKP